MQPMRNGLQNNKKPYHQELPLSYTDYTLSSFQHNTPMCWSIWSFNILFPRNPLGIWIMEIGFLKFHPLPKKKNCVQMPYPILSDPLSNQQMF